MTPVSFNCFEYDSNYLIAYALENAIVLGHDFENPYTLHSDIRHTRFSGCSGPVLLEQSSNERSMNGFYLYQLDWLDVTRYNYNLT
jgi:hypothetical protein